MLSSSERKLYVGTLKSRSLTYGVLWPSKSVFMYPWNISTAEAFLMAAPSFLARSRAVADTLEHGLHYPVLLRLWQFVPHSNFKYSLCENVPSYLCSRSLMSIGPSVIAWIPINKWVIHNHQSLTVQHVASHARWDPGAFPQPFLVHSDGEHGRCVLGPRGCSPGPHRFGLCCLLVTSPVLYF